MLPTGQGDGFSESIPLMFQEDEHGKITRLLVDDTDDDHEYDDDDDDIESSQMLPVTKLNPTSERVKSYARTVGLVIKAALPIYCVPSRISSAGNSPTAYLDSLRGYAAFIVYVSHLWYIFMKDTWRRYPFVSTLFSGNGMVSVFYIISGYALGHGLLLNMHRKQEDRMLQGLASSTFRRYLRLYGSCVVAFIIVLVLVRLRIYDGVLITVYKENIWTQLSHWFTDLFKFCNPFAQNVVDIVFDESIGSNYLPQLWTIPVEYRGSVFLFAFCTAICRLSPRARMLLMWLVIVAGYFWQVVYISEFAGGLLIAQLAIRRSPERISTAPRLPTITQSCEAARAKQSLAAKIGYTIMFMVGFLLLGEVDMGKANLRLWGPFPWTYLNKVIPFWWTEKGEYLFWLGIGSFILVYSLEFCPMLQKPLHWTVSRYLGDISFGLYAMHLPFGRGIKDQYLDPWREEHLGDSYGAHLLIALIITPIVITAADYFTRLDRMIVRASKRVQDRLFTSWDGVDQ